MPVRSKIECQPGILPGTTSHSWGIRSKIEDKTCGLGPKPSQEMSLLPAYVWCAGIFMSWASLGGIRFLGAPVFGCTRFRGVRIYAQPASCCPYFVACVFGGIRPRSWRAKTAMHAPNGETGLVWRARLSMHGCQKENGALEASCMLFARNRSYLSCTRLLARQTGRYCVINHAFSSLRSAMG